MANLILNKIDVTELLKKKYARLGQGWVTLLLVPVEKGMTVNVEAIRVLQSMGYEGIYVTLSKDYIELAKLFRKEKIDMGKLAFIDGISQMYGVQEVEAPNVTYVSGPLSIDAIAESIRKTAPTIEETKKFVFLDSITTVLLYNSLDRTMRFSQFLTETLKTLKLVGIVVSVSRGFANETLLRSLSKLADEVINLQIGKR